MKTEESSNKITNKEEFELNSKRWKNRRRMAWLSLMAILVVTYYSMVKMDIERIEALSNVITWFYTIMGSIVCAYCGLATFDDIKDRESK